MSLLMDALKKAELAKRRGESVGASATSGAPSQEGLALEPMPAAAEPPSGTPPADNASPEETAPQVPSHLEDLDEQFLAEVKQAASARVKAPPASQPAAAAARGAPAGRPRSTPAGQKAAPGPSAQDLSSAQNLFSAKQSTRPTVRKNFAIVMGVFTILAAGGIGGYVWWQLQPKSGLVAARVPMPHAPASASAPSAVAPAPTLATAPVIAPVAAAPGAVRPATAVADDKDDDAAPVSRRAVAPTRRAISTAPAPTTEPTSPVRVTKAPLKVNPALTRGFDAFNRSDLAAAQLEYSLAQKADPRNPDALHGLAAVAVRQGRLDQAEQLYRQLAEADPHDTVAMSALINLRGQMDPNAAESRLKSLSADQPDLAAPQFSLGNLYARHGRWSEAQHAYFKAYSAEPDNPDILYNLAISLEHLRQNKLAAKYYSQAIAAAQTRPAGFDKAQATARLNSLQP